MRKDPLPAHLRLKAARSLMIEALAILDDISADRAAAMLDHAIAILGRVDDDEQAVENLRLARKASS